MQWNLQDWAGLLGKKLAVLTKEGRALTGQLAGISLNVFSLWVDAPGLGPIIALAWDDVQKAVVIGTGAVYQQPILTFEQLIRGAALKMRMESTDNQEELTQTMLGAGLELMASREKKDFLLADEAEEVQKG